MPALPSGPAPQPRAAPAPLPRPGPLGAPSWLAVPNPAKGMPPPAQLVALPQAPLGRSALAPRLQ